jgi:hypothetical protein
LNDIEGVRLPEDSINRRPSIDLWFFDTDEKLGKFFEVYEWIIEKIIAT